MSNRCVWLINKQKFIIFASPKPKHNKMKNYVSKERRQLEKELLFYLRKFRFFSMRFKQIDDLNKLIAENVEELKK